MRPRRTSCVVAVLAICAATNIVGGERAYPLGCSLEPKAFFDYEASSFPPTDLSLSVPEDYLLVRRLGAGKFSDVFEAVDVQIERRKLSKLTLPVHKYQEIDPNTLVVLKCLKPVSERKIKRELMVLRHASDLPNMVRLLAVSVPPNYSRSPTTKRDFVRPMPALVLEHAGTGSQWFCHTKDDYLSDHEIRYYLYHLLLALDALHAKGIMHRDVKPRNVLINRREDSMATSRDKRERPLTLIDLGLADFFLPNTRYNVRVASRHYKSPELLVGYEYYDYAIDMWGVGCILVGLLLRREPFFRGKDNMDQLGTIVAVLGTADLHAYLTRHKVEVTPELRKVIHKYTQRGGKKIDWMNHEFYAGGAESTDPGAEKLSVCQDGLDLVSKLLVYDHEERFTAKQAMQHEFFDSVRDQVQQEVGRIYKDM